MHSFPPILSLVFRQVPRSSAGVHQRSPSRTAAGGSGGHSHRAVPFYCHPSSRTYSASLSSENPVCREPVLPGPWLQPAEWSRARPEREVITGTSDLFLAANNTVKIEPHCLVAGKTPQTFPIFHREGAYAQGHWRAQTLLCAPARVRTVPHRSGGHDSRCHFPPSRANPGRDSPRPEVRKWFEHRVKAVEDFLAMYSSQRRCI